MLRFSWLFVPVIAIAIFVGYDRSKDLPVGMGFASKYLCSKVFNTGLPADQVVEQFLVPKVQPLPLFWQIDIDYDQRNVTMSSRFPLLRLAPVTAQYRPNMGCTLTVNKSSQQLLAEKITGSTIASLDEQIAWPLGSANELVSVTDIDSAQLDMAVNSAFTESDNPRNTSSLLVAYDGQLIAERYALGIDKDKPLLGWSMTKTITGTLIGTLVDQKRLALDQPAPVESWQGTPHQAITLRHLMNMHSGLEFDENYKGLSDASQMLYLNAQHASFAASRPQSSEPGQTFNYSTGDTAILAHIVQKTVGGSSQQAYNYFQQRLFQPLGIRSAFIEFDESGHFTGGAYAFMKARDWLRLGQLYLQQGRWQDQQIVSSEWIDFATQPAPMTDKYGGQLWLNHNGVQWPELPHDAFYFAGHQGQRLVVVPSQKLVVLRTGVTEDNDDIQLGPVIAQIINALPEQQKLVTES